VAESQVDTGEKMNKIGLALGGGGAKGMAHLGILRVLEKEGIQISAIAGTSVGALVGGAYCLKPDVEMWIERFLEYFKSIGFRQLGEKDFPKEPSAVLQLIDKSLINFPSLLKSFFNMKRVEGILGNLLPKVNIEDLQIPFAAISCDILSGKEIVFKKGDLRIAIDASSTVPGIWPPLEYEGMYLMDGGIVDNIPVDVCRELGAEKVIAVDVRPDLPATNVPKNRFETYGRVIDIQQYYLAKPQLDKADLAIRPELEPIPWADFRTAKICIALGEKAARVHLKEIKSLAGL